MQWHQNCLNYQKLSKLLKWRGCVGCNANWRQNFRWTHWLHHGSNNDYLQGSWDVMITYDWCLYWIVYRKKFTSSGLQTISSKHGHRTGEFLSWLYKDLLSLVAIGQIQLKIRLQIHSHEYQNYHPSWAQGFVSSHMWKLRHLLGSRGSLRISMRAQMNPNVLFLRISLRRPPSSEAVVPPLSEETNNHFLKIL